MKPASKAARRSSDAHYRYERTVRARFLRSKAAAKRRGITWGIPFNAYRFLILDKCHYCGGSLNETGVGLDRLSSKAGYTVSNCVPCCWTCNNVKSTVFRPEAMAVIGAFIRYIRDHDAMALYELHPRAKVS